MKVTEVVLDKIAYGWSPEEIHFQHPHLSLAQIHAALTYYYVAVRGRVQIPSLDGSRMGESVAATTRGAECGSYQGVITTEPGKTARVRQTAIKEGAPPRCRRSSPSSARREAFCDSRCPRGRC